jgi:dimethylhistidine N-methyltransferase
MSQPVDDIEIIDFEPASDDFRLALVEGLRQRPRNVPCKFLYDARGSELFEQICELDDYYSTRKEMEIFEEAIDEMAERIGPRARIVEFGSGSGRKTEFVLQHLHDPVSYLPIEISKSALRHCAASIQKACPTLEIVPICADYMQTIELPEPSGEVERTVGFFPGSTIGNFEPEEARAFLERIADMCGEGGGLLLGVDLIKNRDVLKRAYDDREGVTAEFNLNLLRRANRELDADFDLDAFEHRAIFNEDQSRIEMHLVSQTHQTVQIGDESFEFESDDSIHTENSYKYTPERFRELSAEAGFRPRETWTDDEEYFSVWYLEVA